MLMSRDEYHAMLGIKKLPNLHLEVSLGCNISCAMCTFHDELKKIKVMSIEDLKKIDTGLDNFGQVHIGDGSEPFINPDVFEIISHLNSKGAKVSVQTNAKLIRTARDAEKIVKSGLMLLSVSLDGIKDSTVRFIRGGLGVTEISRAIDLINEAKLRLGSSTPYLVSNAVAMRCNLDELPELATFLLNKSFCSFRIGFLELRKPNNQLAGELLIYDMPRAIDSIKLVKEMIERHPQPMHFDDSIFKFGAGLTRRENCTGYKDRFYVNYSGDMFTCYGKRRLGNIFENGLLELISSKEYDDYVRKVTVSGNSICGGCSFCEIMSLDKVSDHFGRRAIEGYSLNVIEKSISIAKAGGEVKEFWRSYSINNELIETC